MATKTLASWSKLISIEIISHRQGYVLFEHKYFTRLQHLAVEEEVEASSISRYKATLLIVSEDYILFK